MLFRNCFFILLGSLFVIHLEAMDIYVSVGGAGQADGSFEHPYHSLEQARNAARTYVGREEVNIWLNDGVYYLDQTLKLDPEDGGTQQYPVYYRALHEGKAIISGGKRLEVEWIPYKDEVFVCDIPEGLLIDQLFIDGNRQEMARFPNSQEGKKVFDCWTLSHSAKADPENDPLSGERIALWENPEGAYLHAMHRALWGGMHYRVKGKMKNGSLDLEGGWQNNRPDRMHELYRFIEHVFEELDAPGEWYYNKEEAKLYYHPLPGADIQKAEVEIVSLGHLIELNGSEREAVKHIHLEGLILKHTARVFMENKEPLLRSDWTTYRGGAVLFNGAEDCSVIRCEFDQLGGNSIFVNNYNRNISILSCYIHESGANGIAFVGDPETVRNPIFRYGPQDYANLDLTPGPKGNNYPSGCLVYDCIIERTGRCEKQTAAIQISMSHRITVSHCSIYDVPRAGINISEGTFGGHIIEYCDIFSTVLETGDHGSFNSWGRDRFWDPDIPTMNREVANNPDLPFLDMLEPNTIRNSRWRCDHGWAIDLDDGSSWYRIYNNLLLAGGLKLREGYHRRVSNNIVVNDGLHPHVWPGNNGDVIKGNIFFTSHRAIAMDRGMAKDELWGKEIDFNLFTSSHQDRLLYAANQCDLNSLVADPGFRDPGTGDYSVGPDSRAREIGFVNFDMSSFGVVSPRLKSLAKKPQLPEVHIDPDPLENEIQGGELVVWKDAQLTEPRGMALSAYGVSLSSVGVAMLLVPEHSEAWGMGFRSGDFVTRVNGAQASTIEEFVSLSGKTGRKKKVVFSLVRMQEEMELQTGTQ